eukprot:SAG11_NODE_35739_length_265_cov_0.626506_1_plen_52_part_10
MKLSGQAGERLRVLFVRGAAAGRIEAVVAGVLDVVELVVGETGNVVVRCVAG